MTPRTHDDEAVTRGDCDKIHDRQSKTMQWVIGLIVVVMVALAGSAWAFISSAIRQNAEHEIRISHLEETAKKIDRMDEKLLDIHRIVDEINRKK